MERRALVTRHRRNVRLVCVGLIPRIKQLEPQTALRCLGQLRTILNTYRTALVDEVYDEPCSLPQALCLRAKLGAHANRVFLPLMPLLTLQQRSLLGVASRYQFTAWSPIQLDETWWSEP